jgi:transposase-like protein
MQVYECQSCHFSYKYATAKTRNLPLYKRDSCYSRSLEGHHRSASATLSASRDDMQLFAKK